MDLGRLSRLVRPLRRNVYKSRLTMRDHRQLLPSTNQGARIMSSDRRLRWLAMAHVSLGLFAGISAPVEIRTPYGLWHLPIVPFFALTFSQVVLLASWAVFSPRAAWRRLGGLVVGLACLEVLFDLALNGEFVGMPSVAMTVISGSLLVLRAFGLRLHAQDDPAFYARPESWRPQFSIRAIMMLTAVVALLSTAVRALRGSQGSSFLGLMVIWSLCFVAVGLLALRAALGQASPSGRMPVILALSPVLGACFAYAADAHHDGWVYIILIMLLYPAVLLGSLLVVRSCGYRLMRG
jgi:hypothetical protein